MSIVKISSYIDTTVSSEAEAIALALLQVNALDASNEARMGATIVTKLYYICPLVGRIVVVVSEADRVILKQPSQILSNVIIAEYPLERLPAQIVDYKEFIVTLGSPLSAAGIINAAQAIAEEAAIKAYPFKIPVVKIINYNDTALKTLVLPSGFGANTFQSFSGISTTGDAAAGAIALLPGSKMTSNQLNTIALSGALLSTPLKARVSDFGSTINSIECSWDALQDGQRGDGYQGAEACYWYKTTDQISFEALDPFILWRSGSSNWQTVNNALIVFKLDANGVETQEITQDVNIQPSAINNTQWEMFTKAMPAGRYRFKYGAQARIDTQWFFEKV